MNENLNLVEILKHAPKGTKLWSPICGDCYFEGFREGSCTPIACRTKIVNGDSIIIRFTRDGMRNNIFADGGCVLFPSKENHDWATFNVPKPHKYFEPFQKVLRALDHEFGYEVWFADFYSHYDDSTREHYLISGYVADDEELIPYEGNEHKLGKLVK